MFYQVFLHPKNNMGIFLSVFRTPYEALELAQAEEYHAMYPSLSVEKIHSLHKRFMTKTNGLAVASYADLSGESKALVGTKILSKITQKIGGTSEDGFLEFPQYLRMKASVSDPETLIKVRYSRFFFPFYTRALCGFLFSRNFFCAY